MGVNPNQILFAFTVLGMLALGVGYVVMPSDEAKMKYIDKKYLNQNQSYRPEVIQKMKEQEKSGQQLMDVIKNTANSDQMFFGKKIDKKD